MGDVDLNTGVLTLDKNKTNDPRAWALRPDVREALKRWTKQRKAKPTDPLFVDEDGKRLYAEHMARLFREHLATAGITEARPQLLECSAQREPIRAHDQRAAFVTLALAAGKSEAWISDRTGHKSSTMLNRYHRQARMASELELGEAVNLADSLAGLSIPPQFPQSSTDEGNAKKPNQHENPCGSTGTRTLDLWIKNPQLCRLSYRPFGGVSTRFFVAATTMTEDEALRVSQAAASGKRQARPRASARVPARCPTWHPR